MYAPFFGLSKEPFSIAPDPRFLFMSEQHREALAHLLYGLDGGGGFVLLTGEIGAGKTTVCRCFLEQMPADCTLAYVFNPKLTATELLQTVCAEFGISLPVGSQAGGRLPEGGEQAGRLPADTVSVKALVDALNAFLLAAHAQGRQAVLVIDEAQSLSADVLEQLRLLTNLETAERKLLQIVLIGQPELREMLARPELEQLAQRVIARYHLGALSAAETPQYIRHRLAVAGPAAALPFDAAALARIHALTGGVPRRINLLADRALLGAYAQGRAQADKAIVDQAAREVFGAAAPAAAARGAWVAAAVVAVAVLALLGGTAWWRLARPPGAVVARAASAAAATARPANAASAGATAASVAAAGASGPGQGAATRATPLQVANDPAALLQAAGSDPATAWRELALRWNVAIGEGDPCAAAAQARLACFHSASGGLAVVRQLSRPGLLTLRGPAGAPAYAVLTGLEANHATLQVGGERFALTLPALASAWRGDFATFWRMPEGWHEGADLAAEPRARDWIDGQLAAAGFGGPQALRERVWSFQLAQGLPPDGRPGPMTLMRLNRAAGVDEPRLQGEH